MAIARFEKCPRCGEPLKSVYKDQSDVPELQRVIGDTSLHWEECPCPKVIDIRRDIYRKILKRT